MRIFHTASDEEIKKGKTTDVYFLRTMEVLKAKGKDKVNVVAEVTPQTRLPENWPWAVLCGVEEALKLLEGYHVNVYSLPEGTIFRPKDFNGIRLPVMFIEGAYGEFCFLETPLLGFICQSSGIATKAARIRKIAGDRLLISFGIRRIHPAIAPMVDRAIYIAGFDGVSCVLSAKVIGKEPIGTMPHSLIIVFKDQVKAWKAFDEVVDEKVPRIALVDTYFDEKIEAVKAAEALGERLFGVRLDTPSSRKGNFAEIVKEVGWELFIRGYGNVKIIVSGGINEENIKPLMDAGVYGFGVGTSISAAPTIDFALDIVEVEGKPAAKRGKLGGKKQVWRCWKCMVDKVLPFNLEKPKCPSCGGDMESMLKPAILDGKMLIQLPSPEEVRHYVLKQLEKVAL
ncbi:MAG: nicotinate phosphoribosyltransferase [Candidatus Bathyarchaeota archaeon]